MHGFEAAVRSRDQAVPGGFRRDADVDVDAAGSQLAGGNAGCADLALRCTGIVFERVQRKRALRYEQGGKEQAWQQSGFHKERKDSRNPAANPC